VGLLDRFQALFELAVVLFCNLQPSGELGVLA
jgi:hypothetical protein